VRKRFVVARFAGPDELLTAVQTLRGRGYRKLDTYSPFPIHGIADALEAEDARLPWLVFLCGAAGALLGYGLQYYVSVIAYPLNVGGRPLHSWPSFIPVTFEMTVLLAAFGAVVGMFAMNGLPRPHHPVFGVNGFDRATTDAFYVQLDSDDPAYAEPATAEALREIGALEVVEVEA